MIYASVVGVLHIITYELEHEAIGFYIWNEFTTNEIEEVTCKKMSIIKATKTSYGNTRSF